MTSAPEDAASRYDVLAKIASGGMATVFVGALKGGSGLRHLVALKRPHQHLLDDPGFRQSLLAEADVASGIRHANVVSVREIERLGESIQLVMDYVEGASLGQLLVRGAKVGPAVAVTPRVALRIVLDASAGLEALHELADDAGKALGFVHRDVSPQNVLVGVDGVARITDFGLAKCAETSEQPTTKGTLKGKLGYMAPEYIRNKPIDARADVFAMGVVTWEALTGKRLFRGESDADTIERVLGAEVAPPSSVAGELTPEIDAAVLRALARSPDARFPTIRAFADALGAAAREKIAPAAEVAAFVRASMGEELAARGRAGGERFATETTGGDGGARGGPGKGRRAVVLGVGALVLAGMGALGAVRLRGPGASTLPPASITPAAETSAPVAAPLPVPASLPSPSSQSSPPDAAAGTALPALSASTSRAPRHRHPASPPSGPPAPKAPPPNPYAN